MDVKKKLENLASIEVYLSRSLQPRKDDVFWETKEK